MRFDSAEYLKYVSGVGGKGAVFYDIIPSLEYRRNDVTTTNPKYNGVAEVAKHIYDAFVDPEHTVPQVPAGSPTKVVPGASNNEDDTI